MQDKFLGMLGICTKAGKTASGSFAAEKAIKSGIAFLVIVAEDASDNTKKDYEKLCNGYNVPMKLYGTKEQLGSATGKEVRTVIAITDESLSKNLLDKISL